MTASPTSPEPVDVAAMFAQAVSDHRAGRLAEAAAGYEQILTLRPEIAEVHSNLGLLLWNTGRFRLALDQFELVLALKPELADTHSSLRKTVGERPEHGRLAQRLDRALAGAYTKIGTVLRQQNRFDEAAARLEQAIALDPRSAEAQYQLGVVLWHEGRLDQAISRYRLALTLEPKHPKAINNLGCTLREQGKLAEAQQAFERLQAIEPDSPRAQMGLGICHLLAGDFERGWPAYDGRLRLPGLAPLSNLPRWSGEPLEGRSLLLLAEQGVGDTIQFVRYARLLKNLGARVVLSAPKSLGRLLASHPDLDELHLFDSGEPEPECDFYLPLLSAPFALGTTRSTIPNQVPYLFADSQLTDHWQAELARIKGFKIGIAWQGSRDFKSDRWRSMPLARFAPLARIPGVRLISLQKGFGSEQIRAVDFPLIDLASQLDVSAGPFMDTAAVINGLDLVITPDTAIGHLAGALGAPVFLALQYSADWRWLGSRDEAPWYPTMRLFVQKSLGQWPDVCDRMATAIQARMAPAS